MRQVGQPGARDGEAAAAFDAAVASLRSGQERALAARPELSVEEAPAPRTLAPFAASLGAAVREGGEEIAAGRFVVLYDPSGRPGWAGAWRVVVYIRADLEPEIAADPLLGQVAWSWLTEALADRAIGYDAPSGTVTRVVTEGFGAKGGEPTASSVELRASWSPTGHAFGEDRDGAGAASAAGRARAAGEAGEAGDDAGRARGKRDKGEADHAGEAVGEAGAGLDDHVAAWCAALCAASGLPPLPAGVTALRAPIRRRGA